jgi:DNA polymerase II large subunit
MHETYPLISNPRDFRFLTLRSLQTSQSRSRSGLYLIEGIRHVARAVEHNAAIQSVFMSHLCCQIRTALRRFIVLRFSCSYLSGPYESRTVRHGQ